MKFVGIDLAWSTRNASGLTVLEFKEDTLNFVASDVLFSDEEIMNYINEHVGEENAIISIDAPLIVPNEEGRRLAEAIVGKLFRKYNAGAHPSNRKRLSSWTGSIRGEVITKLLEENGYIHDPYIKKYEESRKLMEVYPHPSIVVLFNLNMIIKYKAKPKRDYEFRWGEFERYLKHLSELPFLVLPKEIIEKNVRELKGKALKNFEDLLDSVFCAYLSFYAWKNPEKCAVLGNMQKGYIMTPILDQMRDELK
jgi:predicted RNase H-like nuclease